MLNLRKNLQCVAPIYTSAKQGGSQTMIQEWRHYTHTRATVLDGPV